MMKDKIDKIVLYSCVLIQNGLTNVVTAIFESCLENAARELERVSNVINAENVELFSKCETYREIIDVELDESLKASLDECDNERPFE